MIFSGFALLNLQYSKGLCTFAAILNLSMYDINKVREDFPILSRTVYNKPLIYLDNGATTQKPRQVVEALVDD